LILNGVGYLRLVPTEVNVAVKFVPIEVSATMILMAMRAAIRPYSIAVAPDSSFANLVSIIFIE